jgi:osmotically-inducible protein OsmY
MKVKTCQRQTIEDILGSISSPTLVPRTSAHTLTGHVCSYAEKIAAEQPVRRVKGVRALAEKIEVRFPSDKKTADDEITTRALDILRWFLVPSEVIKLNVHNGLITLSGEVESQYQKIAAGDAACGLWA